MLRRALTTSRRGSSLRTYNTLTPSNSKLFIVSEEVRSALQARKPVVALESTIYTHGFPYPDNLALASHLESVVRLNGGTPATIGILNGQARVGLSADEIIELASAAGKEGTMKVSRRELAFITGLVGLLYCLHRRYMVFGILQIPFYHACYNLVVES